MTQSVSGSEYDVAIIGLGPVGCMAAILLSHYGLSVVAIERDREVYRLPRAVNLDGEIVRALQPVGLANAVDSLLQKVRPNERVGFANSKREFLFGYDVASSGVNGWQPLNMFDQPELEGFLRKQALTSERVSAFIGHEAIAFEQDTQGVSIDARDLDSGATHTVTARWMIGTDGASSFVRRELDLEWRDLGYDHDWLVVDVTLKEGHTLENTTLQVCDPDRITTYVCTKDPYRRWEFKLLPGETWDEMRQPERIEQLLDAWTPRGTYEIRRAAVYQFHAATADQWQRGRVFIAGDAAHQTPPFLGQGMNAGMRDVINLSWKMALVHRGLCEERLLEAYHAERDAHAHDLVEWAVSIGRLMDHLAATEDALRRGEEPPAMAPDLMDSGYGKGREQPPLRAGVLMHEQVSREGATGSLCSQPTVRRVGGAELRLDDLLGGGFAVLATASAIATLSASSRQILGRIGANLCSVDDLEVTAGRMDRILETSDAVVLRPDRYIFGHTDDDYSLNDLIDALAERLALTTDIP